MLRWITIPGGLLIMMGQHTRSEALFYYFCLEDQVPETHLLRLIEKHICFAFVREKLKDSYSETGRPSIDPELLRILLIGYLYGVTSERKLVEELNVRNRAHAYIDSAKRCGACSQKTQCTSGRYKYLAIHRDELARQRARELANTPEFAKAQRERKKVEARFAELKHQVGLRRLRLRRLKFVREQFFLATAAQNITRLVRFLSQPTTAVVPATA